MESWACGRTGLGNGRLSRDYMEKLMTSGLSGRHVVTVFNSKGNGQSRPLDWAGRVFLSSTLLQDVSILRALLGKYATKWKLSVAKFIDRQLATTVRLVAISEACCCFIF